MANYGFGSDTEQTQESSGSGAWPMEKRPWTAPLRPTALHPSDTQIQVVYDLQSQRALARR